MIDIVVSDGCPFCPKQLEVMRKSFREGDYHVIRTGTKEFDEYDLNESIDGFPFVVIRDKEGRVRYAAKGDMDPGKLDARKARDPGRSEERRVWEGCRSWGAPERARGPTRRDPSQALRNPRKGPKEKAKNPRSPGPTPAPR